ncbi:glutathione-independent formaldehyde dehydrogenase [Natronocalculus amylovorans]|uniref:Glutathione-independent formaldehyde dehydrogenase n=1 Tax=Natronocalculus amylovorans TaxID=2917812 RepID=A0AAE3FYU2_9EURY|nr:glutathione-independent formaldehyde dehydrogenase [Natronocalculus amylovorans]MCL9817174.1 glutathione-independent formaldehyde dehydrogenase [Natronocalculus amylovorans]NUE02798.1 glutathione-independent formaldehyde dehydrogenase [Halorubraceae archaeon YAN]
MQAVVYKGPHEVAVEEVEEPELEHPNDVLIDITTSCICGSDLHMYEGRTAAEEGIVFGHENMGVVTDVGDAVSTLEEGDRIVLPFNVSCGFCQNCEEGYTGFCTNVNPGFAGGAYGYVAMGPYKGGQAEKLRVPYADHNALKLPEGQAHEDSFALLADIFPTGWHGTRLADLQPGESIAIYGAGPVGLMAAYSAHIQGASEIYIVDRVPSRLELAEEHCNAQTINFEEGDPVEQIKDAHGSGVDKGVDAVGYQAIDPETDPGDDAYDPARENPAVVLNQLIQTVRPTGRLGIPGLYVPSDPGAPDEMSAQGRLGIDFGKLFEKGQKIGTGQCNVKRYNRYLRDMIISGEADPSWVVSHRVGLEEAPEMYEAFDNREEGVTKVLLEP